MASAGKALILIEDGSFIFDNRVKRQVKTLETFGFGVSVICPRYPGESWSERVGQTYVYRYPKVSCGAGVLGHACEYACSLLFGGLLSLWVAARRGFDVIQLCNPPDFLFPIAVFFRLFGKRYVYDHHDLCPELFESRYGGRRPGILKFLLWSERRSWRSANGIISTNESYRQAAIERGGVDPASVIVVRNGPDLGRYREWIEPVDKESIRVGYIGNMNPQDGVDFLLRAAHYVRHELDRKNVEFVLIGKGDSFEDLRALSRELKLEDCVRFTGRISDADVLSELGACDIGCQPDPLNPLNNVSTMNKAMEYMALGKPVVAFDLVETKVSCGDAALYAEKNDPAELGDLIVRLADDFELRCKLARAGRRRVEETLAWKYSEKPYLSMYYRVLGREMPEDVASRLAERSVERSAVPVATA
jgi:glycosyltransferase involved in cell wall biosynthesis